METLEDRVRRLERANRRMKLIGGLLGLTVITCGGGVTSNYALVRTGRLEVVDDGGTIHVLMDVKSGASITFQDESGPVTLDAAMVRRLARNAPNSAPANDG